MSAIPTTVDWSMFVGIGQYWSVLVGIGRYWSVSVGRVGICRQRGLTPPYMVGPSCQRNVLHLVPEPFPLFKKRFLGDLFFFAEKQLGLRYYCDFKTVSTANRVVVLRIVQKPVSTPKLQRGWVGLLKMSRIALGQHRVWNLVPNPPQSPNENVIQKLAKMVNFCFCFRPSQICNLKS